MKKSSGFECALAAANDHDSPISEAQQILELRCVCDEHRWNVVERRRSGSEGRNTTSDDHSGREEIVSVLKLDQELSSAGLDAGDIARIDVRNGGALIPQTVINKAFKGDWRSKVIATDCLISVQSEGRLRVSDM
jgi:hypothetical protein